MVKPPKTMQPEAVNLEKAGRASGRAFQNDSRYNYMARKIDMQRNQFGVQLPPPPLLPPSSPPKKKTPPPLSITSPSRSVRFTFETNHQPSSSKKKKRIKKSSSSASMTAILERLQQRHGQGNERLGRKRKRDKLSDAALSSKWFAVGDDEIPFRSDDEEEKKISMKMPPKNETGIRIDDSPNTVPKSIAAQVPSKEEKVLAATKENTDDETDAAFPSSPSNLSPTPSPRKLRQCRPDLFFLGIVVKVNGYTDPCNETLKRMLQKHGGDFETYETQRVTHILAESLSKAKADIYKKMKKPIPVCTPAWIVDSVQAAKLLAHGNYLLDQLRDPEHNRIASFFCGSKQLPEESSKKVHKQSCTKQGVSYPLPCQPESSKSTKRIMPQPQTEEATHLDSFVTDAEECKPLIDTAAVESPSTSMKQTTTGETLSLKGMEEEETAPTSSVLERHHSSAASADRRDQSSTSPGFFEVDNNDVGGDGDCVSEDERIEFPKFGQQSPMSSAYSDEASGLMAIANSKVAVSVEKEVDREKDSGQQVELEMVVTSKLLNEEATAKQIERRGKSDDKYIDGKIRTTGTDPYFLDSFFSNSRLSFIGSYKQRTKTKGSPRKVGTEQGSLAGLKRFVFHVDMDCFFANVVLRNFPEHRDKPVVISHHGNRASDNTHNNGPEMPASKTSTSECATCNYKAREYGIKKGMFLGHARQLCPNVIVLYYDFEGYEEVSDQLQDILESVAVGHDGCAEIVSCDEAYLELLLPDSDTAGVLAESIRAEIFEKTQCTASIGVGANKFLAKLGTDRVKPDGSYVVKEYRTLLESLRLRDLHGIGYRTESKLAVEGLETIRDVWDLGDQGEGELCRILGLGLGKKIFMYCKGKDDRQVKPGERKSIGAECNYGVRFDGPYGVDHLISGLAKEVQKRMETVAVKGRRVTLKIRQRKEGAPPAGKFLGHGSCHNLSKSLETPGSSPTNDANIISRIGMILFSELAVPLDDVRGIGIMLTKLDNDTVLEVQTAPTNRITNWLKKYKPDPEPLERTKGVGRASVDDSDHETEDRLGNDPRPKTGQIVDLTFGKQPKTNKSAFAADTDMNQVNDDDVAGFPPHFQKEIMSDAEESCESAGDLIRVSSQSQQFQRKSLSGDRDHHASRSGTNPFQLEKELETTILDSSPPALTQLALPPFSQIHMSQVQALPQSLQKQILARIEIAEHLEDFSRERTETICIDDENDNTMTLFHGAYPAIQDTEDGLAEGPLSYRISAAKAKKAPRLSEQSSARFRQSSLQRMMRLAAVKAGKETTEISLTQLDQLPLDIQLQVANGDFYSVGSLSQRKHPPHPKERSLTPSNRRSSIQSSNGNRDLMPSMRRGEQAFVTVKDKPPTSSIEQKGGAPFDMGSQKHSTVNTEADEPIEHDPRAFYVENVAPLKVFCDENSSLACDTVQQVVTFLKTCLTEGRSRDVVVLFRSVRNRADGWSNQEVLYEIARALDNEQMKVNGTRLDIDWLLGR